MSAGYDAEVADLFRDLRAASNLTEADLAARIATPVEVVQALEQGAIYALPPWPETCRVVSAYGTLLNLDTRPLLRRIYAQLEAGVVELGPKPVQDVPVMVPPAAADPTAPQAGQPTAEVVNGTPQPQPAPQEPGQGVVQQASPEPTAQALQQAPAWPESPLGVPQPVQPEAPHPQAAQPQAPQPQPVSSQPLQPQPLEPQPAAAPPEGAL
ncbi:MAG: helix-turn-helix transcriptional regulator, partial [Methyloceanibacter sp.]